MASGGDFQRLIDRAAGLTLDAACELRQLHSEHPETDEQRLTSAIARLEATLLDLFYVRNFPCHRAQPKPRQMQLL